MSSGQFEVRKSYGLTHFPEVVKLALRAAGEGWHGALAKYPPQSHSAGHSVVLIGKRGKPLKKQGFVGYKRTGTLGRKAKGKLEVRAVSLGGVFYTPYVINERKKPESMNGKTIWPGKLDEAKKAAEEAFKVTVHKEMAKGI